MIDVCMRSSHGVGLFSCSAKGAVMHVPEGSIERKSGNDDEDERSDLPGR